jgi:hypothetical protein
MASSEKNRYEVFPTHNIYQVVFTSWQEEKDGIPVNPTSEHSSYWPTEKEASQEAMRLNLLFLETGL